MHFSNFFLIVACFIAISTSGFAQQSNPTDISELNFSYQYDLQSPVTGKTKIALGDNQATAYLNLSYNANTEIESITYLIAEGYASENIIFQDNIDDSNLIRDLVGQQVYKVSVPLQENSNYLFFLVKAKVQDLDLAYTFDSPLKSEMNFPLTDLVLMEADNEVPLFSNFVPSDTPFKIKSVYSQEEVAYLYYYNHDFEPNPPPMSNAGAQVQKSLEIDSIFAVELDQEIEITNKGLYFAQLDTTSLSGISFRVEDNYYPRMVTASQLVNPIRYISTTDEMDLLEDNEDEKLALDRYWVKVTRSKDRAKTVIRDYYRQVTKSNILFTTYKEGWKTSQGMVYLLYGPPDEVYRNTNEETWIYKEQNNLTQGLSFTFAKVKNIFSSNHYNLIPDEAYSRFWFRNIDLWRKGRKQL